MTSQNFDQTSVFSDLIAQAKHPVSLRKSLSLERLSDWQIPHSTLTYLYGASWVNPTLMPLLQQLVDEQGAVAYFQSIGKSDSISGHRQSRNLAYPPTQQSLQALRDFSDQILSGRLKTLKGTAFRYVVQIGIGGSYLGPKAVYEALAVYREARCLPVAFVANIDPEDLLSTLASFPLSDTLFLVTSKSGTTAEPLANLELLTQLAAKEGISAAAFHRTQVVMITRSDSTLDQPEQYLAVFPFAAKVGGRFSATSPVGTVALALGVGMQAVEDFLKGAYRQDAEFETPSIRQNAALMSAALGVIEFSLFRVPLKLIIPYSHALSDFPSHIQQLACESNGKSVSRTGEILSYRTCGFIGCGSGTLSQHSFFQFLHQGSDLIPVEFIGIRDARPPVNVAPFSPLHAQLNANLAAQIIALATGVSDSTADLYFPGNRPSTVIVLPSLTPQTLGGLLSFYEAVVVFQGAIWNLNSFDQPGVELGKLLAASLLDHRVTASTTSPHLDSHSQTMAEALWKALS